jgi:predicted permease
LLVEIFNVLAPVIVCASIGFIWAKSKSDYPSEFISRLVFNVAAPCLVVSSIAQVQLSLGALIEMAGATFMALASVFLMGGLIIRLLGHDLRTYIVSLAFPNIGNMGLPICLFAFGPEGLALAVAYFMVISIAHFSIGMAIASGEKITLKHFYGNPILWAIVIACLFVGFELQLPVWFANSVGLIGQATIPLMLITLGVSLAQIKVSQWGVGLLYSVLRIALGLFAALITVNVLELEGVAKNVVILQGIMPVAVFNYLFALKAQKNVETLASLVMISTLLAMVAIPLVLSFLL